MANEQFEVNSSFYKTDNKRDLTTKRKQKITGRKRSKQMLGKKRRVRYIDWLEA